MKYLLLILIFVACNNDPAPTLLKTSKTGVLKTPPAGISVFHIQDTSFGFSIIHTDNSYLSESEVRLTDSSFSYYVLGGKEYCLHYVTQGHKWKNSAAHSYCDSAIHEKQGVPFGIGGGHNVKYGTIDSSKIIF